MKLLVLAVILTSCWGQLSPGREIQWDYSEWQPILKPCPSCRESRILEAKPAIISSFDSPRGPTVKVTSRPGVPSREDKSTVIQVHPIIQKTNIPHIIKSNVPKAPLVLSQQPRSFPTSFITSIRPHSQTKPAQASGDGNQVRLVYLPEGSIQQLNEANAAKIIPPSQAPNQLQLEGVETLPPLSSPQVIQSIDFSDKQKRDHEGRIVPGGATNNLPMSLITTRGHENDAREKLKLLEAALASPIEQDDGKLPRVFIAPSHVPPPPGYVKIPLVPQGKPEVQENSEEPLPQTFLTPDARNPPPGFVKFDLPSAVSQLSKDIPVVVPNSQVEPNLIFNRPSFSPTPGPLRPDASLNFQAQDVRAGKNLQGIVPTNQVISNNEPKSAVPNKSVTNSKEATTKSTSRPINQNSLQPNIRLIQQRPTPAIPQNNFRPQFFPPQQPSILPQQFQPNPNQPRPFAPRPGQPPFTVFPGQPAIQAGQPFRQPNQPIPPAGSPFNRPEQFFPPGQQFIQRNPVTARPNQEFFQLNQPVQRPGSFSQINQVFPQQGQPLLQPGQTFPRIIQHFQQPNQFNVQPDRRPIQSNPNENVFRSSNPSLKSDFPQINTPIAIQNQNVNSQTTTFLNSRPTTPEPPRSSPIPHSSLSPVTTLHSIPNSGAQFSPRPQEVTPINTENFPSSTPQPFSPVPQNEQPVFPPRPFVSSTPAPVSLTPQSSFPPFSTPGPFNPQSPSISFISTPRPTSFRPTTTSFKTPSTSSATFTTSRVPFISTTPRPFVTSPNPIISSSPRPRPVTFSPQTPFEVSSPRSPFQQSFRFDDSIVENSTPSSIEQSNQEIPFFQTPRSPAFQDLTNPSISSLEDPDLIPVVQEIDEPQIPAFQNPLPLLNQGPLTVRIPSFQRPKTATITRFPSPQSPRVPSFQTPNSGSFEEESSQEFQEPGKRQRLPIFPRFQKPRITTLAPNDGDQNIQPEFIIDEEIKSTPSNFQQTTLAPPTTVAVTTFKPKFNFNIGNRRPLRRKPQPTEEEKKATGDKKSEGVTLFPPFSVARTLNPLRNEEESDDSRVPGQAGVTLPPAGAFGRRLRPRTKLPAVRSGDNSEVASSKPSGLRARKLVGNKARELPDWLKARRRIRGRFRGPASSTTTENVRVVDTVLEDDVPLDILENNEFSGAESTLVIFNSPPENIVADPEILENNEEFIETLKEVIIQAEQNEPEIIVDLNEESTFDFTKDTQQSDTTYQPDTIAEEAVYSSEILEEQPEVLPEPNNQENFYEDYSLENTEVLPEPEPEPLNKYVEHSDEYEDDTEDSQETYITHDQPLSQPPSFPYPQSLQSGNKNVSKHSHLNNAPLPPTSRNSTLISVKRKVDYSLEEIDDSSERYVGHEISDELPVVNLPSDYSLEDVDDSSERYVGSESNDDLPVANLPSDEKTIESKLNDSKAEFENEISNVKARKIYSYEDISSDIVDKTVQLAGNGEGREDADGVMDWESQDHREDSYQGFKRESPEILSLFPNDYFTALSPGQLQDYDSYEYDSYVDEDYTDRGDQNFGGSSAQVVFAVPVTEYEPEETTLGPEFIQDMKDEAKTNVDIESESNIEVTTEFIPETTEYISFDGEEAEFVTELFPLNEIELVTENPSEFNEVPSKTETTTQIAEVEVSTLSFLESFFAAVSTTSVPSNTKPVTAANSTVTPASTARPASIRPLHERLQDVGKKASDTMDKKSERNPKILAESTVTEIRVSDPIICFRDNQCVRTRRQRRHQTIQS